MSFLYSEIDLTLRLRTCQMVKQSLKQMKLYHGGHLHKEAGQKG